VVKTILWFHRHCVSRHDLGDYCGNGESLLVGCIDGSGGGLCGVPLQFNLPGAFASGGSAIVVFEIEEADPKYWPKV
jgi:hypothetical protein